MSDDDFESIMNENGFTYVPIEEIRKALEEMEKYLLEKTGLSQERLSELLVEVRELLGDEVAYTLGLDEIVRWVKAIDQG